MRYVTTRQGFCVRIRTKHGDITTSSNIKQRVLFLVPFFACLFSSSINHRYTMDYYGGAYDSAHFDIAPSASDLQVRRLARSARSRALRSKMPGQGRHLHSLVYRKGGPRQGILMPGAVHASARYPVVARGLYDSMGKVKPGARGEFRIKRDGQVIKRRVVQHSEKTKKRQALISELVREHGLSLGAASKEAKHMMEREE